MKRLTATSSALALATMIHAGAAAQEAPAEATASQPSVELSPVRVEGTGDALVSHRFGEPVDSIDVPMGDAADNFWFTASFKVKFAYAGNYVVKFYLPGDDGNYTPIATKTIISE